MDLVEAEAERGREKREESEGRVRVGAGSRRLVVCRRRAPPSSLQNAPFDQRLPLFTHNQGDRSRHIASASLKASLSEEQRTNPSYSLSRIPGISKPKNRQVPPLPMSASETDGVPALTPKHHTQTHSPLHSSGGGGLRDLLFAAAAEPTLHASSPAPPSAPASDAPAPKPLPLGGSDSSHRHRRLTIMEDSENAR
jgi:hypothetical protein